jgi:hypothetical protein
MNGSRLIGSSILVLAGALSGAGITYTAVGVIGTAEPALPYPVSVSLHRVNIIPGKEQEFEEWMEYLRSHHDEAVATLDRERTYFEAMFTAPDEPHKLYWIEVRGAGGASSKTSPYPIDQKHREYRDATIDRASDLRFVPRNAFAPNFLVDAIREHQLSAGVR